MLYVCVCVCVFHQDFLTFINRFFYYYYFNLKSKTNQIPNTKMAPIQMLFGHRGIISCDTVSGHWGKNWRQGLAFSLYPILCILYIHAQYATDYNQCGELCWM